MLSAGCLVLSKGSKPVRSKGSEVGDVVVRDKKVDIGYLTFGDGSPVNPDKQAKITGLRIFVLNKPS